MSPVTPPVALFTVMVIAPEVVVLLSESVAYRVSECAPLLNFVVSSEMLYGLLVSGAP